MAPPAALPRPSRARESSHVHSIEPFPQGVTVNAKLAELLAVQRQHRYSLAVAAIERRVERDVDLLEIEAVFASNALDFATGLVA